jgi:hypothetical protein
MIGKVRLAQNNCIEALQICADAVQSGDADAIKAAAKNLKRVQEILFNTFGREHARTDATS